MKTTPLHLLVVEDNQDTAFLMQAVLEERGEVSVASDGSEALELARQTHFDLILMDINLGQGPNGSEVLSMLRAEDAYAEVPIAAVTAYALPGDREHFLKNGFDTYLRKPFTADELLHLIDELVQRDASTAN